MKIRTIIKRAVTAVTKKKTVAVALVSLIAAVGAISKEDVALWTDVTVGVAALMSTML
jgi:hypothetical protein